MPDPKTCRTLLIFGGSFDPPHRAHVELPLAAARAIRADGVLFVPAGSPPHKTHRSLTPASHRLAMLKQALAGKPETAINGWELNQTGPSYTVQTLEHLKKELGPGVKMHLLIGADMAAIFDTWKDPQRIEQLAPPRILRRPGEKWSEEQESRWKDRIIDVPSIDVSSTRLRELLKDPGTKDHRLLEYLDPGVLAYIRRHRLYQAI